MPKESQKHRRSSVTSNLSKSIIIFDSSDEENRTGILGKALPKRHSYTQKSNFGKTSKILKYSIFFLLVIILKNFY